MLLTVAKSLFWKKADSENSKQVLSLISIAVFNIVVWLLEQGISHDYEFLSVTYVITGLFLLFMYYNSQIKNNVSEYELAGNSAEPQIADSSYGMGYAVDDDIINDTNMETFETATTENDMIIVSPPPKKQEQVYVFSESEICKIMQNNPSVKLLTVRECEVLRLLLENRKRRDIATALYVSENTIKKHTSHIFAKLEVGNRKELFAKMRQT